MLCGALTCPDGAKKEDWCETRHPQDTCYVNDCCQNDKDDDSPCDEFSNDADDGGGGKEWCSPNACEFDDGVWAEGSSPELCEAATSAAKPRTLVLCREAPPRLCHSHTFVSVVRCRRSWTES